MDENQEYKHICKFCRKGFPCGRSLGGHMRSHMNNTQVEVDERESNNNVLMVGSEVVTHPGYGLRENPKKSWRFSDSRERNKYFTEVCEECGERFKSWKSLLKHMRYHSQIMEDDDEEVEVEEEEDSWTGNNQKIVMDSQSDNETAAASLPAKRRRSRRTCRYLIHKNINNTNNSTNSCSSVSEIEHEQEEVAISLMMLSRDVSSNRFELDNSIVESSDNNSSLFLESRSSSLVKKIKEKEGKILFNGGDHNPKKKKPRSEKTPESKSIRFETKRSEMGSSGLSRNGINKIKSKTSINGFSRDDKFKNPNYLDELERTSYSRNKADKSRTSELGKNMINDLKYGKYNSTKKSKFNSYDNNSTKKSKFDSYDNELDEDAEEKTRSNSSEFEIRRGSSRKNKYKCMTCNKNFHSYQALGGHRASHKKIKGCFASRIETSETSTETDISHDPKANSKVENTSKSENFVEQDIKGGAETSFGVKKKSKYECPYCFKVFSSGQALGGHKRSHLVGGSEHRANQTMISHEKLPVTRDLLDLNLPPTGEEETIEDDVGFKPW